MIIIIKNSNDLNSLKTKETLAFRIMREHACGINKNAGKNRVRMRSVRRRMNMVVS